MAKKSKSSASSEIRDRIKDFKRVPAAELLPNPKNWRTHPDEQKAALSGVLKEIGIAAACIVRELGDGNYEIIDGHLRHDTLPDAMIPILVLDVSEAEADKLLATMDPLAAMAEADKSQLEQLLHSDSMQWSDQAVADMIANLAAEHDIIPVDDSPGDASPECDETPKQWKIIIECRSEAEQNELFEALESEGRECQKLVI